MPSGASRYSAGTGIAAIAALPFPAETSLGPMLSEPPARMTVTGRVLGPDGAIAGSTLTLEQAVARAVEVAGVKIGDAVTAASHTPARVLGLADRVGSIAQGKQADLLLLDEKMAVCKVMVRGRWQSASG